MLYRNRYLLAVTSCFLTAFLLTSCGQKNPPRDEIPVIKDMLAKLGQAIRDKNPNALDSLIEPRALQEGMSASKILAAVYAGPADTSFYNFGQRQFYYTKDEGVVNCVLKADSVGTGGREVEIVLDKVNDRWLVKQFNLK